MPSVVDPVTHRGGAGSVARGLLKVLGDAPLRSQVEVLPVPAASSSWSHALRQGVSFARALAGGLPAKPAYTYSKGLRDEFRRRLSDGTWDLLILNGSDLLWLLDEVPPDLPVLLIALNIEYSLYQSQIENPGWPARLVRGWLDRDCRRLKSFELEGLKRVRNVIFLSTADAELARQFCPELHALVVPPLFDEPRVPRTRRSLQGRPVEVLFPADFSWWPNRDGFRWFLEEVLPSAGNTVRVHVAGNRSEQLSPRNPNIVSHGFVPSARDLWSLADILICPIFRGGGVKVKLAQALYHRVPVLATNFAARGLPLSKSDSIVLLDRAEEWVQFFRCGAVRELAARTVPLDLADAYSLETGVGTVRKYVSSVLCGSKAAAARLGA